MRPSASVFFGMRISRADFGFGIDAPRFGQGHFMRRIVDGFDDFLHGEELDRAGLGIHIRDIIFVGAVMLARGDQHGVLDRVEHDLRVDALFLAQNLDGLKDRFQSALLFCCRLVLSIDPAGLPLELQVGLLHLIEGNAHGLARRGFERDDAVREAGQRAFPSCAACRPARAG